MCGRYALGINILDFPQLFNETAIESNDCSGGEQQDSSETIAPHKYEAPDQGSDISRKVSLVKTDDFKASYNIAPTEMGLVVYCAHDPTSSRSFEYRIEPSRFGLVPNWAKPQAKESSEGYENLKQQDKKNIRRLQSKYFNCRKETLSENRSVWNTVKNNRCVIPIQGYFEWMKNGKQRSPFFVCDKKKPLIFLAGLYSFNYNFKNMNSDNSSLFTFTIITGPATEEDESDLSWLHNRKPIIIQPGSKEWSKWLDPQLKWSDDIISTCLDTIHNKAYNSIRTYKVTKDIGSTSSEGKRLIKEEKDVQRSIDSFFSKPSKRKIKDEAAVEEKKIKKDPISNIKEATKKL